MLVSVALHMLFEGCGAAERGTLADGRRERQPQASGPAFAAFAAACLCLRRSAGRNAG